MTIQRYFYRCIALVLSLAAAIFLIGVSPAAGTLALIAVLMMAGDLGCEYRG